MLNKFKHYVFPENPLDGRITARLKLGAMNYGQVESWWPVPPIQRWLRNHHFHFKHGRDAEELRLAVSGSDVTHLWVAHELLIEQVYELDAVPFKPDVVLDLGANIGLFTLLAHQRWSQAAFVCVEPHPETFSFLCENLALNGVTAAKLQCALDIEPGFKFMENEGAVFQTLSSRASSTRVFTMDLSALIPRERDVKLLVKMDIEGSEVPVLNHLTELPEQTFFFIELHDGDVSLRWIHDWAERFGFAFQMVRRREEAVDGYLVRTTAKQRVSRAVEPVLEGVAQP